LISVKNHKVKISKDTDCASLNRPKIVSYMKNVLGKKKIYSLGDLPSDVLKAKTTKIEVNGGFYLREHERNIKRSHILKGRTYISVQTFVHFKSFYEFCPVYND
jgi:hypothetical protein